MALLVAAVAVSACLPISEAAPIEAPSFQSPGETWNSTGWGAQFKELAYGEAFASPLVQKPCWQKRCTSGLGVSFGKTKVKEFVGQATNSCDEWRNSKLPALMQATNGKEVNTGSGIKHLNATY